MRKIRYTSEAENSFESIGIYTQKNYGIPKSNEYLRSIDRKIKELADNPMQGVPRNDLMDGLRSARKGKHIIFYSFDDKEIIIANILHEKMDFLTHLPIA